MLFDSCAVQLFLLQSRNGRQGKWGGAVISQRMSVILEAIFSDLQLEFFCGIIQENGRNKKEAEGLQGHPSNIIPSAQLTQQLLHPDWYPSLIKHGKV